ncbi:MAG: hypothetical protein JST19_11070 [Bacteroidetes bacterium]|nr:hypothetical protein [Bacteroidota bacterium]
MNTKRYAILLALVAFAGFLFIGIIIFHDPVLVSQRSETVYLDTNTMKEAGDSILNTFNGPAVEKLFPAGHQNKKADTVPWADAYLCSDFDKANLISGDTLVLVLDMQINDKLDKIQHPNDYWTSLKKAPKFKKCKIVIPADQLNRLKRARYKFAHVTLVTDD